MLAVDEGGEIAGKKVKGDKDGIQEEMNLLVRSFARLSYVARAGCAPNRKLQIKVLTSAVNL